MQRSVLSMIALLLLLLGVTTCGDGGDKCPGRVCTNCSGSGDCNMTCTPPQVNFCGHFGLFEDPNLRCTFCESPDFKF